MARGTFLYGVGAAKAGTTWLAQCLRAHPECALPPVKETHYFDSVESGKSLWAVDSLIRNRQQARDSLATATSDAERARAIVKVDNIDRWLALVATGKRDDARYEELMQARLKKMHSVVADVTPAYALLKASTFARMAALNDGQTRFLMILRDPLDRFASNMAMTLGRRAERGVDTDALRMDMIRRLGSGRNTDEFARSNYAKTLSRLDLAVPEQKRMVVFFEELFQPETMELISAFIGLDAPLEPIEEKVNEGSGMRLSEEERSILAPRLKTQYEDVLARFGRVPERWQSNLVASGA